MNKSRNLAEVFEFSSYQFMPLEKRVVFRYKTVFSNGKEILFSETLFLPKIPNLKEIPNELLFKIIQDLHIIIGISYYKLYCPKIVLFSKSREGISKEEADFWNEVYKKGLGEFFYKNNLDPKISPKFPYIKGKKDVNYLLPDKNYKFLVGIGGGKDSIVAFELLKKVGLNPDAFYVQTGRKREIIENVIKKADAKCVQVLRVLDEKVFENHRYGGHIPISVIYGFLGVFLAVLYRYSYVVVGNEYSSSFANLKYKGVMINHQWSKSYEFEKLFDNYLKKFVTPDIKYFSLLRPFYEIRVVKMFSKLEKYFPYFSSCNKNFKIMEGRVGERSLWCGQCAKCVFVFILLSAFLSKKKLLEIFNKNLYEDKNLLPLFKDVLGLGGVKPFDCVGTFEETQTAFDMVKENFSDSFIVNELGDKVKCSQKVFTVQQDSNIPDHIKFLGMENALILGYGKEGQTTEKYFKKYYPFLKIGIADIKQGKDYLKKQESFDIAVKTPGINKNIVKIPYTTATNILFSQAKGKNMIIGVTGSKGKSTTASLIYEILKVSGKKAELLGNIGKPMIERLSKPVRKGTIFILELSSFQLDDIKYSPDIAVVTNLFAEHMDYHGNIKNYYGAKKNIINFQTSRDYFVYSLKNKTAKSWLKNYKGKAIHFSKTIPLKTAEVPLLGDHNIENIKAAVAVAKILEISNLSIIKAIKNFKSLPHRLEFVGKFKGIYFYDDGSSTNPESAILAIKSLKNIDTIFLGGEDRGYDFSELEKTLKKYKIRNIALFPDSGKKIIKSKNNFNIIETKSMEEAVYFAYKNTKKGKICLLSGASPSYSLWKNFEEKGDQFKKFVKQLNNISHYGQFIRKL